MFNKQLRKTHIDTGYFLWHRNGIAIDARVYTLCDFKFNKCQFEKSTTF